MTNSKEDNLFTHKMEAGYIDTVVVAKVSIPID